MGDNSIESRFDDILALVIANSRGEVSNDAVESALASVIPSAPAVATLRSGSDSTAASDNAFNPNRDGIILDTDNYDFDDDDDEAQSKPSEARARHTSINVQEPQQESSDRLYQDSLEDIPLGKMGSKMLTTFGDGPQPDPQVVKAALLGARSTLQRAVLDARALYRRMRDQWFHARASALTSVKLSDAKRNMMKTVGAIASSDLAVDNELSFRALNGAWEREMSCGFDMKSLKVLFPEEMNAYHRWKKMHDAYSKSSNDDVKTAKFAVADEVDDANNLGSSNEDINNSIDGSRLYERLGNFDARTHHMNSDSYMQFADVRRGSFLPRKGLDQESKKWAKSKSVKKKGNTAGQKHTTWTNLHPSSVIFLHWLGFDPLSSLPPPDEDTTQALGFLAHDFLGKIVEKAVALHLEKSKAKSTIKKGMLPELSEGDQLSIQDIDRAISETSLRSLYSSSDGDIGKSSQIAQLYFGPGFEDRLELELEEIFGAKDKRLTPEELKMRQEEELLFSSLTVPPPMVRTSTEDIEGDDEEYTPDNKKQRT